MTRNRQYSGVSNGEAGRGVGRERREGVITTTCRQRELWGQELAADMNCGSATGRDLPRSCGPQNSTCNTGLAQPHYAGGSQTMSTGNPERPKLLRFLYHKITSEWPFANSSITFKSQDGTFSIVSFFNLEREEHQVVKVLFPYGRGSQALRCFRITWRTC